MSLERSFLGHEGESMTKFRADDFKLSKDALDFCSQPEVLLNKVSAEELPQKELGYSDDMMLMLYQIAVDFSLSKQHDKAAVAFAFITTINPFVAPFWIGKGVAEVYGQDLKGAERSFKRAIAEEPESVDGYLYAVKFYLDQGDVEGAQRVLEEGKKSADVAQNPDDWKGFLELVPEFEEVIRKGE